MEVIVQFGDFRVDVSFPVVVLDGAGVSARRSAFQRPVDLGIRRASGVRVRVNLRLVVVIVVMIVDVLFLWLEVRGTHWSLLIAIWYYKTSDR